MSFKKMFKEYVPNPLSAQSTLPDVAKKAALLTEALSFPGFIKNLVLLVVFGAVFTGYFKIPLNVVGILIGTQILLVLTNGYITVRKITAIKSIGIEENGRSFRAILITSEYYEFVKTILGFVLSGTSVACVLIFFPKEISQSFSQFFHGASPPHQT